MKDALNDDVCDSARGPLKDDSALANPYQLKLRKIRLVG